MRCSDREKSDSSERASQKTKGSEKHRRRARFR